jgi:hypothetical protein
VAAQFKSKARQVLEAAATRVYIAREELAGIELANELRRLKGHLADPFSKADEILAELKRQKLLYLP